MTDSMGKPVLLTKEALRRMGQAQAYVSSAGMRPQLARYANERLDPAIERMRREFGDDFRRWQ